jgi:hypothetical protein
MTAWPWVDTLHGQAGPPTVRTARHHLVKLAEDQPDLRAAKMMLRRRLAPLYLMGREAISTVDGGVVRDGSTVFALDRISGVSKISGTGGVAYGVELRCGGVVLTWVSPWTTVTAYGGAVDARQAMRPTPAMVCPASCSGGGVPPPAPDV